LGEDLIVREVSSIYGRTGAGSHTGATALAQRCDDLRFASIFNEDYGIVRAQFVADATARTGISNNASPNRLNHNGFKVN
jgi:hypothetical protein